MIGASDQHLAPTWTEVTTRLLTAVVEVITVATIIYMMVKARPQRAS